MSLSPLRYAGGKSRAAKQLIELFPEKIGSYAEPFAGGCSVGLELMTQGKARKFLFNDRDYHVWNFWDKLRNPLSVQKMVDWLEWHLTLMPHVKKAFFKHYQDELKNSDMVMGTYEWENAARYFYVNRCSFSGAGLAGGFSASAAKDRFTQSSIDKLKKISKMFWQNADSLMFMSRDYWDVLGSYRCDFAFLDPPYYGINGLYPVYTLNLEGGDAMKANTDFDHEMLATQLKNYPRKFLLTYNDCPEIKELYSWAKVEPLEFSYGMSKNKQGKELIIRNY